MTTPEYVFYKEAAEILGVKTESIYTAVARKRLNPISVPGSVKKKLKYSDVLAYKTGNVPTIVVEPAESEVPQGTPFHHREQANMITSETLELERLRYKNRKLDLIEKLLQEIA